MTEQDEDETQKNDDLKELITIFSDENVNDYKDENNNYYEHYK
jgi:hypothetical protein